VKQEVYRVAERHARKGTALNVFVVSNSPIAVPRDGIFGGPPDAKPGTTFAGDPLIEHVETSARHHSAAGPPASMRRRRRPAMKRMTAY
jgi:hypothetical protein